MTSRVATKPTTKATWAGPRTTTADLKSVPLYSGKKNSLKSTGRGRALGRFSPAFAFIRTGSSSLVGRPVRMPTVARFLFVVLISVLHLVSIVLLTLSLVLGYGGLVEAAALSIDWLALIIMAVFLLHRVRFPQREYIRPRSMTAFYGLTFVSAVNLTLLSARLASGNKGLVHDFEGVGNPEGAAGTIVAIAVVSTLLGIAGAYVSHTGCYIEPKRQGLKPLISWPVHDWHPFPTDTPIGSPMSPHYGRPRKYIPGLVPAFQGARTPPGVFSEQMMSQTINNGSSDRLIMLGGYQDMESMRRSMIAGSRGPRTRVSVYMAGPNGSTFELVPPPVPPLPPSVVTKGGQRISLQGGGFPAQRGKGVVPLPQPPAQARVAGYQGRRASAPTRFN